MIFMELVLKLQSFTRNRGRSNAPKRPEVDVCFWDAKVQLGYPAPTSCVKSYTRVAARVSPI